MWKKLYSNSGLILLAVLAVGIWFNNLQPYFQSKNTAPVDAPTTPTPRKSAEEILGVTPQPPPGPRLSVVESYELEQRQRRAQASPSPKLSAVEIEQRTKELEIELERAKTDFDKLIRQRRPGATAICRDGTYSYSASRRGTCSWHGGVAKWLR